MFHGAIFRKRRWSVRTIVCFLYVLSLAITIRTNFLTTSRQQQQQQQQEEKGPNSDFGVPKSAKPPSPKEQTKDETHHSIQTNTTNVHVVISHCDASVEWILDDFLKDVNAKHGYEIKSIVAISKCGIHDDLMRVVKESKSQHWSKLSVVETPNVGRCDHSYAFWITKILFKGQTKGMFSQFVSKTTGSPFAKISSQIQKEDIVLFMKDGDNTYRRWENEERITGLAMFDALTSGTPLYEPIKHQKAVLPEHLPTMPTGSMGMICKASNKMGPKYRGPHYIVTDWAHRSVLWTFSMGKYLRKNNSTNVGDESTLQIVKKGREAPFKSEHRPMGEWIYHLAQDNSDFFSDEYLNEAILVVHEEDGYYHNHTYRNMKDAYHSTKGIKLAPTRKFQKHDLVSTCFGGVFATRWGQIASDDAPLTPEGWCAVTNHLGRGDNIEEGHYMERWWADLLTWSTYSQSLLTNQSVSFQQGLTNSHMKEILDMKLQHWEGNGYHGLITLDGQDPNASKPKTTKQTKTKQTKDTKRIR